MRLLKITTKLLSMLVLAAFAQTAMADRFEKVTPFIGTKLGLGLITSNMKTRDTTIKQTDKLGVFGLQAGVKYKQFGLAVNGATMFHKHKFADVWAFYTPVTLDAIFMLPVGEKSSIDFTLGAGYSWLHINSNKIASRSVAKVAVEYNYYFDRNVTVGFGVDRLIGAMSIKAGGASISMKSLFNAYVGLKYHFM